MRDDFAGYSGRYPVGNQIVQGPRGDRGPRGDALRWEDLTVEQVYSLIPRIKVRAQTLESCEKATAKIFGPKDNVEIVFGIPRGPKGFLDVDLVRVFNNALKAYINRPAPLIDAYPWFPQPPKKRHCPKCKDSEYDDSDYDDYDDDDVVKTSVTSDTY